MSKDRVIDSLGRIDDDMIQSVEALRQKKKQDTWKKWSAMAACFCLLATAVAVVPYLFSESTPLPPDISQSERPEHTKGPLPPWTIHFNETSSMLVANRAMIKGVFTEPLNDVELAALMPGMSYEYMSSSGHARFDDKGHLLDITIQVTTTLPESPVTVGLADYWFGFDFVLPGEELVSICNGVKYKAYQYELDNTITLSARAKLGDIYLGFAMDTTKAQLEQAKADFKGVLECFAYYEEGHPDLSFIVPEEIPELMEQVFTTLSEARTEPDFGRYLPFDLPAGFGEATIYRFKFQNSNFLSALWSKGLDDLAWVVEPYTEENAHRLTSVQNKESYDLSLYPIPRADSVPDELREVVDNPIFEAEELTLDAVYSRAYKVNDAGDMDGWRMRFSVKYGDVIVSVSTKGVDPEWLYHQLVSLLPE